MVRGSVLLVVVEAQVEVLWRDCCWTEGTAHPQPPTRPLHSPLALNPSDCYCPGTPSIPCLQPNPTPLAAIVGDDADLILMALIAHHPRLYVINSALNDGRLAPTMPVFSVMHLHEAWAAQMLPKQRPVNLGQVGHAGAGIRR